MSEQQQKKDKRGKGNYSGQNQQPTSVKDHKYGKKQQEANENKVFSVLLGPCLAWRTKLHMYFVISIVTMAGICNLGGVAD